MAVSTADTRATVLTQAEVFSSRSRASSKAVRAYSQALEAPGIPTLLLLVLLTRCPTHRKELPGYPDQETMTCWKWKSQASCHLELHGGQLKGRLARARPAPPAVPYRGALPLTQESYGPPAHPLRRLDRFCPLVAPWRCPHPKPVPGIYSVPKAYCTENSRYGSARAELV